jgi:uncharacterized protein YebE (UPF0316 family)
MEWFATIPVGLLCVVVFLLRVCDVTLGTLRTVAIVKGRISSAVVLGFFELIIWVAAISQVITRLGESWWVALAYAGGFATGNGVGVMVERRLALGTAVTRILSVEHGAEIAGALRRLGHEAITFVGDGGDGPVTMIYAIAPRRSTRLMLEAAGVIDPDLVYVSEPAHESNSGLRLRLRPTGYPTGWRAVLKKK